MVKIILNYKMLLRQNEKIIKIFRHHRWPFIFQTILTILILIPFFILLTKAEGWLMLKLLIPLKVILLLLSFGIIIYNILVYWLYKLIVTNQRIIHVDWKTLTEKEVHDIELADVQHVKIKNSGIIDNLPLLDYGIIEFQGGADSNRITFMQIPNPAQAQELINKLIPYKEKISKI